MDHIGEKMKKYIGSRDYKAASPIMRQTLVYVVNEDLSEFAKKIEEPTLLSREQNERDGSCQYAAYDCKDNTSY